MKPKTICAIALITGLATSEADDWHQWGGPERNFHVSSAGLDASWGPDGPERLWSRALGEGYSSIVLEKSRSALTANRKFSATNASIFRQCAICES